VGRKIWLFDSIGTFDEQREQLGYIEIPWDSVTEAVSTMPTVTACSKRMEGSPKTFKSRR
jgi:hypothetical protein